MYVRFLVSKSGHSALNSNRSTIKNPINCSGTPRIDRKVFCGLRVSLTLRLSSRGPQALRAVRRSVSSQMLGSVDNPFAHGTGCQRRKSHTLIVLLLLLILDVFHFF